MLIKPLPGRLEKNLFVSILFLTSVVLADNRLRLKKANVLENKTINGESVKYISGNVVFTKGTLTLNCQEGRHYEKNELAVLYRNVSALQDGRTLTCDTLKFYSKEDRLFSIGSPHVWDPDYDLKADSLTVFTEQDSGVALGNVILIQKGQVITANRIEYQKDKVQDGVSYTAIGNVTIEDSSRIATCGRANYDRTKEVTVLEIEPEIKDGGRILSGEKIVLTYKEEELKKLHIPKKAFALTPIKGYQQSQVDSLALGDTLEFEDNMEGSRLTSFFKKGTLDSLRIEGMAKTLYHVFEDSIYQGKNNASGDTIIMTFLDNELDRLKIM
ncbi:MAG: LptA/OstA family protein, partial [Candidatus Neomarinimicrobiota bacterium]|nr:LptA/OstA family protein [Candidatus Neomarinimicrobiota bacterium]